MSAKTVIGALVLAPVLLVGGCATVLLVGAAGGQNAQAACTNGTSVSVQVDGLPEAVAGYKGVQLQNAAAIMKAGADQGLDSYGQTVGVMTSMGEAGLRVLDNGDAVGPDSRGLFQQRANGAWGTYADRMNPYTSASNFFKALQQVAGWRELSPTQAAHRTQRNADLNYYAKYWSPAVQVVATLSGNPGLVEQLGQNTGDQPCGAQKGGGSGSVGTGAVTDGWARPAEGPITSKFGARAAPTAGASTFHKGIDFGGGCGKPIYAAAAGRVINSGPARGFGHWIVLEHEGGYRTVYGHMEPEDLLVKVGENVTAGQLISRIGNGGTSTGCHLHFEVHDARSAIDPIPFLREYCRCID
ncbi:M23 family metallopeptidase [Kineococcus sp. R86509]|uniref:M23 family metallopeptidase n=1 Tax=Kineococcus sp. R86509 TaxID=3093851 RepID=UPI0036D31FC7